MKYRRLLIALAVVIVAGAVVALLLLRNHRVSRGSASSDEIVRESVSALAAGDVDRLVALADPLGMFDAAVTCGPEHDDDDGDHDGEARTERARQVSGRDPEKILASTRADFTPIAAAAKGLQLEVIAINGSETSKVARGAPMMAGCHAKRALRFVRARVTLRISGGSGAPREQQVVFTLAEVDGRYFLSLPPLIRSR